MSHSHKTKIPLDLTAEFNAATEEPCQCNGNRHRMMTCNSLKGLIHCKHKKYVFRFFPLLPKLLAKLRILSPKAIFHEKSQPTREEFRKFRKVTIQDIQTTPVTSNVKNGIGLLHFLITFSKVNSKIIPRVVFDLVLYDFIFRNFQILEPKALKENFFWLTKYPETFLHLRLNHIVHTGNYLQSVENLLTHVKGANLENTVITWLGHMPVEIN